MRKWLWLILAALISAAPACGSAGGAVVGAQESCTRNVNAGTCEGSFAKLSGTYDKVVAAEGCHTNVAVAVEVSVTVESGGVYVKTTGPDGMDYTATASPGSPAMLIGAAAGCTREFHVIFAATEAEATGVEYTIRYEIP